MPTPYLTSQLDIREYAIIRGARPKAEALDARIREQHPDHELSPLPWAAPKAPAKKVAKATEEKPTAAPSAKKPAASRPAPQPAEKSSAPPSDKPKEEKSSGTKKKGDTKGDAE